MFLSALSSRMRGFSFCRLVPVAGAEGARSIYYDIGLVKEMVHDMDGAIAAYRHAIQLNPENWRALNALGSAYVEQGNIDKES